MSDITLDTNEFYEKHDSQNMLNCIETFVDQLQKAQAIGKKIAYTPPREIKNIVVTGLGGSGIGGDIVRSIMADKLTCPLVVNRNYTISIHAR